MRLLRTFPPLDAPRLIRRVQELVPLVPDELWELLVRHPHDPATYDVICGGSAGV